MLFSWKNKSIKLYIRPMKNWPITKNKNLRKYSKKWQKSFFFLLFFFFGLKTHNFFNDYCMELFFSLKRTTRAWFDDTFGFMECMFKHLWFFIVHPVIIMQIYPTKDFLKKIRQTCIFFCYLAFKSGFCTSFIE